VLMDILDNRRIQLCGAGAMICSWFLTSYICCGTISHWDQSCPGRYRDFFDLRAPYESNENAYANILVEQNGHWAIAQVGAYLFSTVMVFGVMSLAPNRRIPIITEYGSRSLTNYIYHIVAIYFFGYTGLYSDIRKGWTQLVVLLMAVLTSLLLMTPWASFAVEWLINPPLGRLGLMASSVPKKKDPKQDNTNTTGAHEESEAASSVQRVCWLVSQYKTPISVVSIFVLLSLAMGILKNPWKPYWEDKALLSNNPYLHLKIHGPASLHCTNWAKYNDTELQQYLYPTNQPTNQPTGMPTTYQPTDQPTANGSSIT